MLLTAAMAGDSLRFTRQEGVEQQWRISAAAARRAPAGAGLRAGVGRPAAADALAADLRRLAGSLDAAVTALDAPHTAARPSEAP